MNKLNEMYQMKGELITKIELFQAQLQRVNQEILEQNKLINSEVKNEKDNKTGRS